MLKKMINDLRNTMSQDAIRKELGLKSATTISRIEAGTQTTINNEAWDRLKVFHRKYMRRHNARS